MKYNAMLAYWTNMDFWQYFIPTEECINKLRNDVNIPDKSIIDKALDIFNNREILAVSSEYKECPFRELRLLLDLRDEVDGERNKGLIQYIQSWANGLLQEIIYSKNETEILVPSQPHYWLDGLLYRDIKKMYIYPRQSKIVQDKYTMTDYRCILEYRYKFDYM